MAADKTNHRVQITDSFCLFTPTLAHYRYALLMSNADSLKLFINEAIILLKAGA